MTQLADARRHSRNDGLVHQGPANMTEKTIDLDQHRGMAAQKATDLRRLLADVEANERALRLRQEELESAFGRNPGCELA
jgi:hypothetical protein